MRSAGIFCVCLSTLLLGCSGKQKAAPSPHERIEHSSSLRITTEELKKWDEIVQDLSKAHPLGEGGVYHLYTYLYCAQKMFADQSFALTSEYTGTLDEVSSRVVRWFYPDYEGLNLKRDTFSQKLATQVLQGLERRFSQEQKQMGKVSISKGEEDWKGEDPVGLNYPTMKPWAMHSIDEFQSPPPPHRSDFEDQLAQTKEKMESATEDQKQKSRFWQRLENPEAADWRYIALQYLNENISSLEMQLVVRSNMMMALMDALIAVFHDKYTYMVKRPDMRDPELKPLFTTPNHPSYPAAHATMAGAAETILMYYFPENGKQWKELAEEAGESRLWGGIHYPLDIEAGNKQGQQVGKAVLFRKQPPLSF